MILRDMADPHNKLLLIGLDAADPDLIERWTDDGTLPNLAALRRTGTWGRLSTAAKYLAGSPWPTFYTGRPPSDHGLYHDFQWRHERMEFAAPAPDWLPIRPFWRAIRNGIETVAHDVPMTPETERFHGVEVTGWGSHDKLVLPDSYPPELLEEIRRRYGESPIRTDEYGRASLSHLRELHEELVSLTLRSAELAGWLLQRPWNLGIVAFGALHRGGHRFWDRSSLDGEVPAELGAWYDGALRELYCTADRAVGDLIAAAPEAAVFVFSLHGMQVNSARVDLLDEMLNRVLHGPTASRPQSSLLRRLGEAMPLSLRRTLTNSVPQRVKNRIMTRWTTGGMQWDRTRAFTLRADLNGYIRLNLQGREPKGIVPPGEAEDLCSRIIDGLQTFRDAATGDRFIEEVCRSSDVFPPGDRSDRLPDLIVRWSASSGAPHAAVTSPTLGTIPRATPGRIPNGRSGNHAPAGLLIAKGPGIAPGGQLESGADILDLAPTALRRLRAEADVILAGKVLTQLV